MGREHRNSYAGRPQRFRVASIARVQGWRQVKVETGGLEGAELEHLWFLSIAKAGLMTHIFQMKVLS